MALSFNPQELPVLGVDDHLPPIEDAAAVGRGVARALSRAADLVA
jgi:hypothetical protein